MPRLTISLADRTHRALRESGGPAESFHGFNHRGKPGTERDPTLRYRQGGRRQGASAVWIERSRRDGPGSRGNKTFS